MKDVVRVEEYNSRMSSLEFEFIFVVRQLIYASIKLGKSRRIASEISSTSASPPVVIRMCKGQRQY